MAAHGIVDQHAFSKLSTYSFSGLPSVVAAGVSSPSAISSDAIGNPNPPVLQNRAFGDVDQLAHAPGQVRLQKLRGLLRGDLRRLAAIFLGKLFGQQVNGVRISSPREGSGGR